MDFYKDLMVKCVGDGKAHGNLEFMEAILYHHVGYARLGEFSEGGYFIQINKDEDALFEAIALLKELGITFDYDIRLVGWKQVEKYWLYNFRRF